MKFAGVFLFATVALGAMDQYAGQRRRLEERKYKKKQEIANSCSNQIVDSITGKLGSELIEQFEGGCAGGRDKKVPNCNLFDNFPDHCNDAYTQNPTTEVKSPCKCDDAACERTACKGRSNLVEFCHTVSPATKCLDSYKEDGTKCAWTGSCGVSLNKCTALQGCFNSGTCTNPDDEQRQALYDELLKEAVYTCCLNGNYFKSDDKAGYGDYGDYNSKTRAEECEDVANNLPDFLA